jgi:hypothetical protein
VVNTRALLALVLQIAYLVAAFGWRTMVHRRRTGDSGFRWQRHDTVARVSGALFAAAILVGTVGVTLAAFSVTELWDPLAGTGAFVAGLTLFAAGCALTLAAQSAMGGVVADRGRPDREDRARHERALRLGPQPHLHRHGDRGRRIGVARSDGAHSSVGHDAGRRSSNPGPSCRRAVSPSGDARMADVRAASRTFRTSTGKDR